MSSVCVYVFNITFDQVDAYAKFIRATPDETGEQSIGGQKELGQDLFEVCVEYIRLESSMKSSHMLN